MNIERELLINQARMIINRMERISADSIFAHRSSGLRGALLRWLQENEPSSTMCRRQMKQNAGDLDHLRSLLEACYEILEKAAREIVR